ncbi:MAG: winged helix DNA-binding domain-containing protein [Actinomycetia bacterium]|nr:winged helix DNA-binding domain-containing protein [Actinomycetes bacterium]
MAEAPVPSLSLEAVRAQWVRRAGFAEPVGGTLDHLLDETGWLRTLGGVDPALALLARRADLTLADISQAMADGGLAVTPAVRNCIYVVPGEKRAVALAEAHSKWERRIAREAPKAGIRDGELDEVAQAVLAVLAGPMTTEAISEALGEGAVRSLGEEGRSVGISSTLPPALRLLELTDRIRRHPVDYRIDTERHLWRTVAEPAPDERPDEQRRAELVADYARHCGPLHLEDFTAWMDSSKRDARAAIEAAGLVEVDVEGHGAAWCHADHFDELVSGEPIDPHLVRLLGFEDLALVAHTPAAWFADKHHDLRLPVWGRGSHTLGGAHHLAMRTVLIGSHMAGFWAWDPERRAVEVVVLEATDAEGTEAIGAAAEVTTAFLRESFGHARMTSIDGDATEQARLDALRAMVD